MKEVIMLGTVIFLVAVIIAIIWVCLDEHDCSETLQGQATTQKTLDYDNLVPESDYKPTCGTPYFRFPDDEFAHTYRGTLLIDPRIGEKIASGSLGKGVYDHLCSIAAQSVVANSGETKVTLWWDKDGNDTPAEYRPFVIFGVRAYDYEEEDEADIDGDEDDLEIRLVNPTNEELEAAVNKFDKITEFEYTTEHDN